MTRLGKKVRKPRKEQATKEEKGVEADDGRAKNEASKGKVEDSEDKMADTGEDKITEMCPLTEGQDQKTNNVHMLRARFISQVALAGLAN